LLPSAVYYAAYSSLKVVVGIAPAAAAANILAAFVRVPPEVIKQRAQSGIAPSSRSSCSTALTINAVSQACHGRS
jgi:hypothetical protein